MSNTDLTKLKPTLCARCIACISLIDSEPTGQQRFLVPEDDFIHQPSLESFLDSVANSCVICNYLHECWASLLPPEKSEVQSESKKKKGKEKGRSFSTDLRWMSPKPDSFGFRVRLNLAEAVNFSLDVVDDA